MKTIWKYQLPETHRASFDMPKGAVVINVQNQNDIVTFWVECDDQMPREKRHFRVVGTGWGVPPLSYYRGTAIIGDFVGHLYEVLE